jgi:hypothetical protein
LVADDLNEVSNDVGLAQSFSCALSRTLRSTRASHRHSTDFGNIVRRQTRSARLSSSSAQSNIVVIDDDSDSSKPAKRQLKLIDKPSESVADPPEPVRKRQRGWPKGKPRGTKNVAITSTQLDKVSNRETESSSTTALFLADEQLTATVAAKNIETICTPPTSLDSVDADRLATCRNRTDKSDGSSVLIDLMDEVTVVGAHKFVGCDGMDTENQPKCVVGCDDDKPRNVSCDGVADYFSVFQRFVSGIST